MINQNIVSYIQECLKRGYDVQYIQSSLTDNGHNPQTVSDTINYVLNQNPKEVSEKSKEVAGISPSKSKIPINKKQLIFIAIGLGVIAIVIIFFLFILNTNKISNNKLSQGTIFDLKENQEKNFVVDGEKHIITIDSVNSKSVDLIIQSKTFEITLGIGDEEKLDLDNDKYYDIKIRLNSITDGVSNLYIKKINEEVCIENWDCEDWVNCSEFGTQSRVCTDLNDCGTIENKPLTSRTCTYVEPCDENWTCEDWGNCINGTKLRVCVDLNECGTIENRPNIEQNCEDLDFLDCGEVTNTMNDCFINASMNCTPARIILDLVNYPNPIISSLEMNMSNLYEIRGWNETNCTFYSKTLSYSHAYTNETIKAMLDQNYTLEEIMQQENETNQSMQVSIGLETLCLYNQEGLTAMLEFIKENNGSLGGSSECDFNFNLTGESSILKCIYNNVTATSFCYNL